MADQTTTKDRIRAVIDEASGIDFECEAMHVDDLAERLDKALFGGPHQDSMQLLCEVVALQRHDLQALRSEVRRLLEVIPAFGGDTWNEPLPEHLALRDEARRRVGGYQRLALTEDHERIAAILREPREPHAEEGE